MPVKVRKDLPAAGYLEKENIFVMSDERAEIQEIRPLRVALLNLMPNKITTETQLLRLISNTPLQVEVVLLRTASYSPKNTDSQHLDAFYRTLDEIIADGEKFDALIITGAPVERMEFASVAYWDELKSIIDWAADNVYSTMYICWAALAAMFYLYGINKVMRSEKISGVFEHDVLEPNHPLMRGFNDKFTAPHSRYSDVDVESVKKCGELDILAVSKEAGLHIACSKNLRHVFVFGHGEYDRESLHDEYMRDLGKGLDIAIPKHYYKDDDINNIPPLSWRAHASLLFYNWLNYCVYQITPYDIGEIKRA